MKSIILIMLILSLMLIPTLASAETAKFNTTISSADKAKFEQILQPVTKIYNFIKYIVSVVALIFLLYGGICYMTAGSDPKQKERGKNIITYVVIGLVVIWAAPLIVDLLV